MKYDFKKQLRSFGYAWNGIRNCTAQEQNLMVHMLSTLLVIIAGLTFGITRMEWIAVILCIGLVIAAELFNTAIERAVDLISPQRQPAAGLIKDISAGAVLVCAVASIAVASIIFIPRIVHIFS